MKIEDALQLMATAIGERCSEIEKEADRLRDEVRSLRDRLARLEGSQSRQSWRRRD